MATGALMRLAKAGLLALAVVAVSTLFAPGAVAHTAQHHVSVPAADHDGAPPLTPVSAWSNAGTGSDACPDADHGRHHERGHAGCCGSSIACSLHCGGAVGVLSAAPALGALTLHSPPPLEAAFSIGLASAPGEPPPRPLH